MKVLVTGGAGFIGANLCRALAEDAGHDVVVLDDMSTGLNPNLKNIDVDLQVGSILDGGALDRASHGVDSIVHLAAVPSVPRSVADPLHSHEVNATGTLKVLQAAQAAGAQVVLASSSSVYGRNPQLPKVEDMTCLPASPYAASKLAAESYAQAYSSTFGLECMVFRFFNVFGPLQRPDHDYAAVLPAFINATLRGMPLQVHGDGEQSRDFTFVETVVRVLAQSVADRKSSDSPVNLAFGSRTSLNEVISLLADLTGRMPRVEYGDGRVGDVRHSQASAALLQEMFPEVNPTPLRSALDQTINWMREQVAVPDKLVKAGA